MGTLADLAGKGTGMFEIGVTPETNEPNTPVVTPDQVTWAKLDGVWLVRLPASVPQTPGSVVTVSKQNGSTTQAELIEQTAIRGAWQFWTVKKANPSTGRSKRSNRYEGNCRHCGVTVPAGEGHLGPKVEGQWTVEHPEGKCPTEETEPEMAEASDYTEPLWPGVYTVDDGVSHRTFRIAVQRHDAKFAPGATIIEYLKGRDNDSDYTGFAFLRGGKLQVWKRFAEGEMVSYAAVLVAHADAVALAANKDEAITVEHDGSSYTIVAAKHCIRCGRTLSTLESVTAGIGPECRRLGW